MYLSEVLANTFISQSLSLLISTWAWHRSLPPGVAVGLKGSSIPWLCDLKELTNLSELHSPHLYNGAN